MRKHLRGALGAALLVCALVVFSTAAAQAKVVDEGKMFSSSTVSQLDQRIDAINRQYHKDVLVVTVSSLNGEAERAVADRYISGGMNGVYIFMTKKEKKLIIYVGNKTQQVITDDKRQAIRQTILSDFKAGHFDEGIVAGVNQIEQDFANAPHGRGSYVPAPQQRNPYAPQPAYPAAHSGGGINWFSIIILGIGIFFLINLFRSIGQRAVGGSYGGGAPGGYGAPGGGGGLMTGLLGGLGGALVGNWLYDKMSGRGEYGGGYNNPDPGGYGANYGGGGESTPSWQQQDSGGSYDSGGSWGDSGGGGGDASGGFGGDIGGGGDSGGGGGGDW